MVVKIWSCVFVTDTHILHKSLLTNEQQGECFSNKIHITLNGEGGTVSRHCSNALIKSCLPAGKLCFDAGSCRQSQDHEHIFLNHSRTRCSQSYRNKMQTLGKKKKKRLFGMDWNIHAKKKKASWCWVHCEPFLPLISFALLWTCNWPKWC